MRRMLSGRPNIGGGFASVLLKLETYKSLSFVLRKVLKMVVYSAVSQDVCNGNFEVEIPVELLVLKTD